MSSWTYINGIITVSPMGRTQAEKRYILETVLNHLPLVTGSEGDMNVYIIQKNGTNSSSSYDEYGQLSNRLTDSYGFHDRNGWLDIQLDYILAVNGSLRDRHFDETFREFMKWLCRLSKRVWVRDVLVRVNGYDKQYVINEFDYDSPYSNMNEAPSWSEESDGEPCWCEHLMWDRAKNSDYPMLLAYKYFSDEENDTEVERRMKYLGYRK